MIERERVHEPYWQEDLALGEGRFYGDHSYTIRLKLHTTVERFRGHEELAKLERPTGERTYVHAKPHILIPEIMLSIGLYPQPSGRGAIGEVVRSDWTGMRHEELGNAQAWYYHRDRLLVLWECYLQDRYREVDPRADAGLRTIWTGFEQLLQERFPETRQIVTPSWEDIYDREMWEQFLKQQGYEQADPAVFSKEAVRE